jgi:hypothetical protein
MFKDIKGKLLSFANSLAGDYYTRHKGQMSEKKVSVKGSGPVKEQSNKPA